MKYLILLPLILLFSCKNPVDIFKKAKHYGCVTVVNVSAGNQPLGSFVVCTEDEYKVRVK